MLQVSLDLSSSRRLSVSSKMDSLPNLALENLLSYIVISYSRIRDVPSLLLTSKRISSITLKLGPQKLPILKANFLASRRRDADFLEYLKSKNLYHLGMEIEGAILGKDWVRVKTLIKDMPAGNPLWDGVLMAATTADSLSLTKKAIRMGATAIKQDLVFLKTSKRRSGKRNKMIIYLESIRLPSIARARPYTDDHPSVYLRKIVAGLYPVLSSDEITSVCVEVRRQHQENVIYRTCPTYATRIVRLSLGDLGLAY